MTAVQSEDILTLMPRFRSAASEKSESSRQNYAKAINCLETFAGTYTYTSDFPSGQTVADWFLNMRVRGLSVKTAIHYLDIISSLSKDTAAFEAGSLKAFGTLKSRVKESAAQMRDCPIDDPAFKKILTLTRSTSVGSDTLQCAADMLLYSLLHRAMSLAEVAKVKTADVDGDDDTLALMVKRNASPTRKYLFALDQSKLTPRQLGETAERMVMGLFIANRIPLVGSVDNTIRLIWACGALKCGIPGSEISAILGVPVSGIPELSLCEPVEISDERKQALSATVSTLFADNPPRWYAMKLRSRVAFEDVESRIKALDEASLRPEFFYPHDEICRRVGKKLIKEKQPVIEDIVFFRMRVTDIFRLFSKIGDLAWCYTVTGRPGGDYAAISRRSFDRFQEAIGHFTPDYEVAPIGGFEPGEGEKVVILNGPLANYEFEVDKSADTDNVIFQLNMVGDNGFQWRTTARPRQLSPTTTTK